MEQQCKRGIIRFRASRFLCSPLHCISATHCADECEIWRAGGKLLSCVRN